MMKTLGVEEMTNGGSLALTRSANSGVSALVLPRLLTSCSPARSRPSVQLLGEQRPLEPSLYLRVAHGTVVACNRPPKQPNRLTSNTRTPTHTPVVS